MVKIALLIGISQYQSDLAPLPGVEEDIKAMQRVLQNPNICGFDEVKTLVNCDRQNMEVEIEQLFSHRGKDDLVLLYFSGHGIKDETGQLYFANNITRKDGQGKLLKATAVEARVVQGIMSNSRSKRQVVILDCCFSGAFAQGLPGKDHGLVDIESQLGGEGRAILTSSTSTQYSLDSIYTRYIVEGLETGAADIDNDGKISIEELHEYTKQQVQEAAPAMQPEIYPIKEGFKIILAQVQNNPELIYRKTFERLCAKGKGEIFDIGRRILNAQRDSLGLSVLKTQEIEEEVLLPFITHKNNLHKYEEAYLEVVRSENSISENTRNELNDLQQILGLRDEDIAIIEANINASLQPHPLPQVIVKPSHHRNTNLINYIVTCVIGLVIGGSVVSLIRPRPQTCANQDRYILNDKISVGEEVLLKQVTNADKEAGVQAFAQGDCLTAIKKFEAYRAVNREVNRADPETLIYLNNAKARLQQNRIKIAVAVPIGIRKETAEEILRGVAQAQQDVNKNGGIKGKLLEVVIANDNDKEDDDEITKPRKIADQFVNDKSILAVVGHNSSETSFAVASNYHNGRLVMMTSTSFSPKLTGVSSYIFRTAPNLISIANELAIHAKKANKTNILICADYKAIDTTFKNVFETAMINVGRKINSIECDLSATNFDPKEIISKAISNPAGRADTLLFAIYIDKKRKIPDIARANQGRLTLLSSSTLATRKTIDDSKADVENMIVAVPWHPQASPPFASEAEKLWGGRVNWRTATSYDATMAISKGLETSNTRDELQKTLYSPSFSFNGVTGKIEFSSGDRKETPIHLLQIKPVDGDEYDFVPIPRR